MKPELNAGPELDRLIAEKVMGWTLEGPDAIGCIQATLPDRRVRYIVNHGIEQGDLEDLAFKPSVNIAHAWEVVERMAPRLRIQRGRHTPYYAIMRTEGGYVAGYWTDVPFLTSPAPTAPLAICRAALLEKP